MTNNPSSLFASTIFIGGLVFGFGLGFSHMARPEVVLSFLQFTDFGLLFVMFGGSFIAGIAFFTIPRFRKQAPLTGTTYARRLKSLDRNVVVGGTIFGIGWGLSGICPGAAFASIGIGNWPIFWGIGGMFLGAYIQGYIRSRIAGQSTAPSVAG